MRKPPKLPPSYLHYQAKIMNELSYEDLSTIFEDPKFLKYFSDEKINDFKKLFTPNSVLKEKDPDLVLAALKDEPIIDNHTYINWDIAKKIAKRYSKEDKLEILAICLYIMKWLFYNKKNIFDEKQCKFKEICKEFNIEIDEVERKLKQMKS